MKLKNLSAFLFAALFSTTALAHDSSVTSLFQIDLADLPDREGLMVTVDFEPGEESAAHRHNAHTFVYVLQGSVVMQVEGGERKVLQVGDTFYENPNDTHTISKNASETEPAKILVFFVKNEGVPAVLPTQQ